MTIKHHPALAGVDEDTVTFKRPKTGWEAFMFIFAGYAFFLLGGWKSALVTLLLTLSALVGAVYVGIQYYDARANTVEIKSATPIKPKKIGMTFSIFPQAYAATMAQGDSIIWDGEFWGIKDKDFECFKVADQPVVLIHDKSSHTTDQMTVPGLQDRIKKNRSNK